MKPKNPCAVKEAGTKLPLTINHRLKLQRSKKTWRNAALWNRKWDIKIREKPNGLAASRRGGSEMWDSGPSDSLLLQYCSVVEKHTNQRAHPTTCFLSVRKRRSAHAQECLFILAGFVLLIIYIWNYGIFTSPNIKTTTTTKKNPRQTQKPNPQPKSTQSRSSEFGKRSISQFMVKGGTGILEHRVPEAACDLCRTTGHTGLPSLQPSRGLLSLPSTWKRIPWKNFLKKFK